MRTQPFLDPELAPLARFIANDCEVNPIDELANMIDRATVGSPEPEYIEYEPEIVLRLFGSYVPQLDDAFYPRPWFPLMDEAEPFEANVERTQEILERMFEE